jgi:drug/metabolite transporter (DMT)-like permease
MSEYVKGILSAFAEPIIHAWANILDNYFSNSLFERLTPLIFFCQLTNLFFLPVIFFFDPPKMLPEQFFVIFAIIALIEILYQYPYFWSLRRADTSVVNALFSLGKISVPIFAFFLVHEHIATLQYLGFFLIVLSTIALTLEPKKLRLNSAFFLMLFVSVILCLQSVLFKYLYDQGVSWGSSIVWAGIFEFALAFLLVLLPMNFKHLKESTKRVSKIGPLFLLAQFLTWSGEAAGTFAVSLIPVSIAKGIGSTQPIFVLLYAALFRKKSSVMFKEELRSGDILKKVICFGCIVAGTILIVI